MKEITFDEGKKLMLDALISVSNFCEKKGFKYSLGYGTLIGAIRHKGFIPWDDDIDIIMLRDDYQRFIREYTDERYQIVRGEDQANHLHIRVSDSTTVIKYTKETAQSKIYKAGIWIDVFPIDKVPDTKNDFYRLNKRIKKLSWYRLIGDIGGISLKLKTAQLLIKPFSHFMGRIIDKWMMSYNEKDSHTAANLAVYYLNFPTFPLNYLDDFIDVEFENHTFKAIKEYDAWLRGIYGDYMELPPEDKRVAHHYYTAFFKD